MLSALKRSLQGYQPSPLSDLRFDQSHERFEGQSNQQSQILQWLQAFGKEHLHRRVGTPRSAHETFDVLSVGCGSGILDLPLIRTLAEHVEAVGEVDVLRYTGIDPNPVACGRFRDEFEQLEIAATELTVLEETVESYGHDRCIDLTHVVHSMYYFADPAVSLQSLIQNVAVNGELVIFQAPKGDLNRLADCFWQGHVAEPIWFSAELDEHLQASDIAFTRSRLSAEVDVTDCFNADCPNGRLTFDFLVQSDCENLSETIRDRVLDHLRFISRVSDGRVMAPHPVDVFVIHSTAESTIHCDARSACSP